MPKTLYKMAMVFSVDLVDSELGDMLSQMGLDENLVLKDAAELTVTQTVPFIPTEEALQKYADALKDKKLNQFIIKEARFARYNFLLPVQVDNTSGQPGGTNEETPS